jgi:hypothetical protein
MKLEGEKFDEVATKVADVRGAFLNKGDFRASTQKTMEDTIAEILKQNNITADEFSEGLEHRVFPHLTNFEKLVR